jgi:hypothetical protein
MRYRKLRITWTVFCGIACVLLCALWVRSYWYGDYLEHFDSDGEGVELGSIRGVVYLSHTIDIARGVIPRWELGSYGVDYNVPAPWSFELDLSPIGLAAPHWLIATLSTFFVALPWLPRRFTTRTLLIALTLVAVALGAIVYATRQ